MKLIHSQDAKPAIASSRIEALLNTITEAQLREWVERISVPRHFRVEPAQNRATASWLVSVFESLGYKTERQGEYANIVACPKRPFEEVILVGAHYDSVPTCPGADDNASAVAAMLACAAACSLWHPALPVVFVAFNCEEDALAGSQDFVTSYLPGARFRIRCAHVLEMVGYASSEPGSQRVPPGLPVKISDRADFLGLLANRRSKSLLDFIMRTAATYTPHLPVTGLKTSLGLEKHFPVLLRSDHAPFWEQDVAAVMWTDTSEFRNPNYHRHTDTPETLDYAFLRSVTQLLGAVIIEAAHEPG
jgi:hypothetical protein